MRLFIGTWPSAEFEAPLHVLQAALRRAGDRSQATLRLTPPPQWHLTLRFLGEVNDDRVEALTRSLHQSVGTCAAFSLRLAASGCFPNHGAPRIVWAGLDGHLSRLTALHAAVAAATEVYAASADTQPFHPHLTLARVANARPRDREHFLASLARTPVPSPPPWNVAHVRLVRSELRPEGARYSVLTEIPLATT